MRIAISPDKMWVARLLWSWYPLFGRFKEGNIRLPFCFGGDPIKKRHNRLDCLATCFATPVKVATGINELAGCSGGLMDNGFKYEEQAEAPRVFGPSTQEGGGRLACDVIGNSAVRKYVVSFA